MKKNVLLIVLMIVLVHPPKMEMQASNCSCSYDVGSTDMTSNPLYQAGLVFGTALVSAVTTQFMPWLAIQVKNGNARKFAIDSFNCIVRRSSSPTKPNPVSSMFPSLALDMVKELGPGWEGLFANSTCMLWFEVSESVLNMVHAWGR